MRKNISLPSSYRPITYMFCIFKTFERMIKTRLENYIESKLLLPKTQYGFSKCRGTTDALSTHYLYINIV